MIPNCQLCDIADKYSCDKGLVGPGKNWSSNNYVDIYQAYLSAVRMRSLSLLEIGLGVTGENWESRIVQGGNSQGGASMKMWAEYLPNSNIYGVDINEAKHLDSDRIKTFTVDQGSRNSLAEFCKNIDNIELDVIIDDGSHIAEHQQISLEILFPKLKSGGIYFIEDLNDRGFENCKSGKHGSSTTISTRKLFMEYTSTGELAQPNAFENTDFFEEISSIAFHSPRVTLHAKDIFLENIRVLLGRNRSGILRQEFIPNSHKMMVLIKK